MLGTNPSGSGDSIGRIYIYGTAHQETEASMATTAEQAKPVPEPTQAAIALGRAETPAGVPQVQKGEIYQLELRRGPTFKLEHPTMEA
jgi:hypothetical protein